MCMRVIGEPRGQRSNRASLDHVRVTVKSAGTYGLTVFFLLFVNSNRLDAVGNLGHSSIFLLNSHSLHFFAAASLYK